jgi:hypothetical protein
VVTSARLDSQLPRRCLWGTIVSVLNNSPATGASVSH